MHSDSSKHKLSVLLKVVIPLAIVLLLVVVISVFFFQRRKQKTKAISLPSFGREFPKISYGDLARATDGFATTYLIGQGRYGSVYQGKLFQDEELVAIKVFKLGTRGAKKSFIAECNALRNVRHHNLVHILTACSSIDASGNDFKALVYEFMPRGDLHNLLYSIQDTEGPSYFIPLAQRLSILVDVSEALAYLHHNHQVRLTIGYIAPECAADGQLSTATDVYSFGVILLEIFIRRRPTDDMFKDGMTIAKLAEINLPNNVLQIVDPQLLQELDQSKVDSGAQILQSVLSIGLCCTKTFPNKRISMQEVAAKLHGIQEAYLRGY